MYISVIFPVLLFDSFRTDCEKYLEAQIGQNKCIYWMTADEICVYNV